MFNVTIPEARAVIRAIKRTYATDISGFAMASFRIRLSEILQNHAFKNTGALVNKLLKEPVYYETFIRDISCDSPDMFRDPDFWIYFRDQLLHSILESRLYPEIVILESVTGDELYTLAVLLFETGYDFRIDLVATCRNENIRDQILEREISNIRFKNSMDNYEVFHPGASFEDYFEIRNGSIYLKADLLEGVEFRLQSPEEPVCSEKTALVLYRNRMIYMNAEMQYRRLRQLLGEMKAGTYFVTGVQESIGGFGLDHLYSIISPELKIYLINNAD